MKKAIVIGASSGIGMEVARLLVRQNWKVGVAARRVDLLKTIGDVETEQIDVTKAEATQQLQELIKRVGGMDLFFYASGIGKQNRELKETVHAIKRKQHIRIIDWRYRLLTALWRRIPRCIWRHMKL